MKTLRNIYPAICSYSNLARAAKLAQRDKRFRPEVFEFNTRLEENLLQIKRELETLTWQPGNYREFYVQEAKKRLISAAPYRDRVVHHALCNVIEPLFDKMFIYDSYACRKGKGSHAAADRYTEFSRKAGYVLKCDISHYFSNIRHDVLYEQLRRRIEDNKALWLCEQIIRSKGDYGEIWLSGRGIPIGNLTSQFFANVYLNDFDHWLKEEMKCRFYIRYVDDFLILSNEKRWLHNLLPQIKQKLSGMGLELHPQKQTVFPVSEGCDFMGYRIWQSRRRLRPSNGYRFQRCLKAKVCDMRNNLMTFDRVISSIMSWIGHAQHADTWGLRSALFRYAFK